MITDLAGSEPGARPHTSVCVAGAGAAGICLAVELAKSGVSVTLLESGGLEEEQATQDLYASEVSGIQHKGVHQGRFRVLGGSTTHWFGQILELDSNAFDMRPWVPNSGWPFLKHALDPYYRRALELEGLGSADSSDDSVWKAINIQPPDFGDQLVPFFSRWCPEPNFARLYGRTLRESSRINVYLHANVCEILLAEGSQTIAGLRCQTLSGRGAIFTADRYVFCLGGVESARVLLQPLAQANPAPWNTYGLVGRYFQDHIDVKLLQLKPRSRSKFHHWFDNVYGSGFKYHPMLKLSAGAQRRLECLPVSAGLRFENAKADAVEEFLNVAGQVRSGNIRAVDLVRAMRYVPLAGLLLRKAIRRKFRNRGFAASDAGIVLVFHCEQAPNPESRIELTSERDATGLFRSRLHWAVTDQEMKTMQQFARIVAEAFRRGSFADVVASPILQAGGAGLIDQYQDAYHHMGATRMADSPRQGVVDANLRLFGVSNGYVCSSSVFVTSGFSNPTHTIIALAARLAEHLASSATVTQIKTQDLNDTIPIPGI